MYEKHLKSIGLTDSEVKVFVELLKQGNASASEISKKTKMHRTNIYDIFESLIKKGLVSYITKNKKRCYSATKLNKLLDYLKEKEEKINEQKKVINNILPKLSKLKIENKNELKAEIYRGKEGLKTLLEDMLLNCDGILYCFGYSALSSKIIPYYRENWKKRRIDMKVKRNIIAKEQMRCNPFTKGKYTETRFVPDEYDIPISTMIYANKVWVLIPEGEDHISLLIESDKLAKSFLNFFNQLWKVSKK